MIKVKKYLSYGFRKLGNKCQSLRVDWRSQRPSTLEETPLRAELFSASQMEQHGRILANSHQLSADSGADHLLSRLSDNETIIVNTCKLLTETIQSGNQVTPAAAWLLDNFYLIEDQIRTAKRHLPQHYSRELPRLLRDGSIARPRVYDIALETVAHGDGRVDPENLRRFTCAYQSITTLTLGELWAIPIMLRLALIENLRRVATRLTTAHKHRELAISWADAMILSAEEDPSNLILLVADMSRSNPPLDSSFVAELVRRLQGQAPTLTLPLNWLSQRLAEQVQTIDNFIQQESKNQAADQLSISNSIGSLRFLSTMDWREFVESMSAVESILRQDPAQVYKHMDFATRDRYRHVIEKIAKNSRFAETDVANNAIQLAFNAVAQNGEQHRQAHLGYFLIDAGVAQLEQTLEARVSMRKKICRYIKQQAFPLYIGTIALLTLSAATLILRSALDGPSHLMLLIVLASCTLLMCSQFALELVNWLVTLMASPQALPRMDFSQGIPAESSSLVVVATILTSKDNIDQLSDAMEVRFLANRDEHLRFCLLSDFADADQEVLSTDEDLQQHAKRNIDNLNRKYPRADGSFFILLHRARLWNPSENRWMSFERKRGKLNALNNFLRDVAPCAFSFIAGDTSGLGLTKYVITLDTDTELPREAASIFIATMTHILNRPQFDAQRLLVTEGYGILQPRIAVGVPSSAASHYELLYGGEVGMDPYTRSVSDVYQDIFAEGSFIGKGIYDIDAFEGALHARMPENRILSHDLLEGCYARAGLLSDATLSEPYPSSYLSDMRRRQRWVRGDWQLASWLLPQVPGTTDATTGKTSRCTNPLSALSRWKLFDNLRRSLVPLAYLVFLASSWLSLALAPQAWRWTAAAVALLLLPPLLALALQLLSKPKDLQLKQHIRSVFGSAKLQLSHVFLHLCFLPYEAWVYGDAIIRTHWRLALSHRRLLEWNPSSIENARTRHSFIFTLRRMWIAPLFAAMLLIYMAQFSASSMTPSFALLLCWFASPWIAYLISLPRVRQVKELSLDQTLFLNRLSRKTWLFFETHVGPEDHWLPPDNVQQHPVSVIAHRTSPTNIGLSLSANLIAYDFAYITTGQLLSRTGDTFSSLEKMERYQGHYFNWYDTRTLAPLQPRYISTVDSGNFSAHLMTLKSGLLELIDRPILPARLFEGLRITYLTWKELEPEPAPASLRHIGDEINQLYRLPPGSVSSSYQGISYLSYVIGQFQAEHESSADSPSKIWIDALSGQCRAHLAEIEQMMPWIRASADQAWLEQFPQLAAIPTLRQLAELKQEEFPDGEVGVLLRASIDHATQRITDINSLAKQAIDFSLAQYNFLYDQTTHLLSIGYNLDERRCDAGSYDLLASEARLAAFVGIAQGQLPQESWFALGRQLTIAGGEPILLSWSGSMFEYLMPLLIMPSFPHTLLEQTYHSTVQRQIQYGQQRGVPWGISESGYNAFDTNLNYQYRAFGVPGLGYKRGLGDDLVIAPYASMMALMVTPEAACDNLQRLSELGFEGQFGFFEAIDYTPVRLPRGQTHVLIRSFMVHHQGMGLLALAYLLLDKPLQKRFEADALFKAATPLLYERVPQISANYANTSELADIRSSTKEQETPLRILSLSNSKTPEVQLLSNGRYHLMVSSSGGSYSRWNELALTRWNEDGTRDNWGSFCYVRDCETGSFWSTALQPSLVTTPDYTAVFSEGRAEFRRRDKQLDLHTEIVVSPEDDIELRRTHIVNRSGRPRTIELTSYAEVALAPPSADSMHPAFSKLFVQTEILPDHSAILCVRRARSVDEKVPTMFHLMALHGADADEVSYETDRMQFIGRGNTCVSPEAMHHPGALSNSAGSVLDPIVAIRYRISLAPEQSVTLDLVTGIADTREQCLTLIEKYRDQHLADRVIELSSTHSQVVLRQLNISEKDAQLYARLANSLIYVNPLMRATQDILMQNYRGQSALWSYAISGDLPIVLLQISDQEHIELARQLIQAHAYWQSRGVAVDLVIWNEDHASYRQILQDQIVGLISSVIGSHALEKPGGIYVRAAEQISHEDRILFQSVARIILNDQRGSLVDQLNRRDLGDLRLKEFIPLKKRHSYYSKAGALPSLAAASRQFDNGTGGFSTDGREYLITTNAKQRTPAPWVNVLANPVFGSVVSESGQAYTWSENAHEFRLSPWHNDPVSDSSGEAFYIRDEETGQYWSPTALPCSGKGDYHTRHGFGYSIFSHTEDGIASELSVFVDQTAPIKYAVLHIANRSDQHRSLSVTGYVEWVLGDLRSKSAMHIVTEIAVDGNGICARNPYNTDFTGRTAFFCVDQTSCTVTADRNEFIGRNGTLQEPAAMNRSHLSGKLGAGLDPCAALQVGFKLKPEQERTLVFILGVAEQKSSSAKELILRHRNATAAQTAWRDTEHYWRTTLGTVQVNTPDSGLNILANGWLLYQTIACRLWARSGYYQSGGAFGFRDQLQDTMALAHTGHEMAKQQILRCAAHQFIEGDVQHWWHPPTERGVRTHCSDDYLWLPLAVARYVSNTGDIDILQTIIPYIEGREVNPAEDSYYDLPHRSARSGTLYEHCMQAIEHGLRFGQHGLPLMGSCDWNDGMDQVGHLGQGESVWLAFFLYEVLIKFSELALASDDISYATHCREQAQLIGQHIDTAAWDGAWYRRAYFDDGSPLGSALNSECQIDSISQSWAILSGAGDRQHALKGMESLHQRLVKPSTGIIQLLDPPFDQAENNPGYIRGYVPGVRENGGQYTHAAIWAAMAFAKMGNARHAWEAFDIINPINHSNTSEKISRYKVEPYVIAADVYAVAPHVGRGGWTWYTGSAGWMYRLITESLLGLQRHGQQLSITPCLPAEWDSYQLQYRYLETDYLIDIHTLNSPDSKPSLYIDGVLSENLFIELQNDRQRHQVQLNINRP
ncbi:MULTISPECIES: GH36-type glycosyl hydrolase domain-containing protein [unclassified Undibacterium]|uniref:GH36-type glycosyl hydrolase domain-containing protein n=1 Tax=unclassified Undibacterium TaxID=2630295 RepID=UPI002AC9BE7B|nr:MULTISPECIES: glucoamylase family protein [unclassified Undibacterium]MEB0138512.1 glucoamylase family protein [Undibacterium sp. CCC2.1]MEB0173087.1 glucoamylase family protein [Undibacterium sp. CCC1.1]MEB0176139.1 glucoamylase family protein [Undibacterium sp. CCC3.4]MEB0215405.1 glucoamylase family protein [Undibacterium sp. 5I2]WPX42746.1 glucoamylase family protein [Undibacterium sp. CCC3.4]